MYLKKVQEAGNHEDVPNIGIEAAHDDPSAFGGCCLAEGQEEAQAGTGDVLQFRAVEDDDPDGLLLEVLKLRGPFLGGERV